MSNILPNGSVNPNATTAPGVYVINRLPKTPIVGVTTGTILVVGTASWGALNSPTAISSMQEQVDTFGTPTTETYDMGTQMYAANSVGATQLVGVRVSDGTDVKASIEVEDVTTPTAVTGMTVTAKYSGTVGNSLKVIIGEGTNSTIAAPTFKVTILFPAATGNTVPEVFDNIGGTGLALWQAMVDAINMGQGALTVPSQLVAATIGTATDEPDLTTYTLAGGTNGNSGVTATTLVGSDIVSPKTGMYAASSEIINFIILSGVTDATTYPEQVTFAEGLGAYVMLARPLGESYTDGIAAKKAAALISYAPKFLIGSTWAKIQDGFNNVQRYIPESGIVAGLLATIDVQDSGLNKQIESSILVSTWAADNNIKFHSSDIATMLLNGVDGINKPSVGGNYWSLMTGKNTSNNLLANGDEYTKLFNFIALSIRNFLAQYVGRLNSPTARSAIKTDIDTFLSGLKTQGIIGSSTGGGVFSVTVTSTSTQAAAGIVEVDISYAAFRIIVNLLAFITGGLIAVSNVNVVSQ